MNDDIDDIARQLLREFARNGCCEMETGKTQPDLDWVWTGTSWAIRTPCPLIGKDGDFTGNEAGGVASSQPKEE